MNELDFRTFIARTKLIPNLDALLVNLFPGQIGLFAKQARGAGIKVPLFGFEYFEDTNEISISQGSLNGAWYATSGEPNNNFLDQYKSAFPGDPYITAANGYDAVGLFVKAFSTADGAEGVAAYLRSVKDYKGALSKYSATGDNRFALPATLKSVVDGGFQELGRP